MKKIICALLILTAGQASAFPDLRNVFEDTIFNYDINDQGDKFFFVEDYTFGLRHIITKDSDFLMGYCPKTGYHVKVFNIETRPECLIYHPEGETLESECCEIIDNSCMGLQFTKHASLIIFQDSGKYEANWLQFVD